MSRVGPLRPKIDVCGHKLSESSIAPPATAPHDRNARLATHDHDELASALACFPFRWQRGFEALAREIFVRDVCERHSELLIEWLLVCQMLCSFSFCGYSAMKRFQSFAGWYVPLRELQWITLNFDQGMAFLMREEGCVSLVGKQEAPTPVATPPPRKG